MQWLKYSYGLTRERSFKKEDNLMLKKTSQNLSSFKEISLGCHSVPPFVIHGATCSQWSNSKGFGSGPNSFLTLFRWWFCGARVTVNPREPFSRNCCMLKLKEAAISLLALALWIHGAAFWKCTCVSGIVRVLPSAKSAEVLGGAACRWPPRYLLLPAWLGPTVLRRPGKCLWASGQWLSNAHH